MERALRVRILHIVLLIHHICNVLPFKGYVQTVAGGGAPHQGGKADCTNADKVVDGIGPMARFSYPWGITFYNGTLFVGDCSCPDSNKPNQNEKIRKIDVKTGTVSTVAGGPAGFRDGPAKQAQFYHISGLAVNPFADNIMYAVDSGNDKIRKVDLKTGIVSTIAGGKKAGFTDGIGTKALFRNPQSIIFDASHNRLFVGDTDNHAIRMISLSDDRVTTLTGGKRGLKDGHKAEASFFHPTGLALDAVNQVLYVADHYNHVIRAVHIDTGKASTLAGGGRQGLLDGTGEFARFNYPEGIAYDPEFQVLYVVEFDNNDIRMVTLKGEVTTLAGNLIEGYLDGLGGAARFFHPTGLAFDNKRKIIYVTDQYNHLIRSISAKGYAGEVPYRFELINQINQTQGSNLSLMVVFVAALVVTFYLTKIRCWKYCFSWRPSRTSYY